MTHQSRKRESSFCGHPVRLRDIKQIAHRTLGVPQILARGPPIRPLQFHPDEFAPSLKRYKSFGADAGEWTQHGIAWISP
jgi:hypothetical protein